MTYSYLMDTTEVTQASYQAIMGENPSQFTATGRPVEGVTWIDAVLYCNRVSKLLGLDSAYAYVDLSAGLVICRWDVTAVRLPTEDEWELAARAGRQLLWPTNDGTISCERANYDACGNNRTVAVASYPANPYGIRDLAGNVAEWCWDRYSATSMSRSDGREDYRGTNNTGAVNRVVRGGHWESASTDALRCGTRSNAAPSTSDLHIGFRCVVPVLP